MRLLATYPSAEALELWQLSMPFSGSGLDWIRPLEAVVHTLFFMIFYSLILAMLLFVFNLVFNRAAGTAIAGVIHVAGYICAFVGFTNAFRSWSLVLNAMFMYRSPQDIGISHSYFYFLLVLCLIYFSGPSLLKRADFKHSSGEQNE